MYTKKIVWSLGVVFGCLALANVLGYVLRLLLARALTPAEFGLVYAVMALFGFISFLQTLGLSEALVQFVPKLKKQQLKSALLSVFYMQLLGTGVILLLALTLAPWLAAHYFHQEVAQYLVVLYGIVMFLSPLEISFISLFQGMGKPSWYGYLTLLRAIVLLGLTILFLHLGFGVFSLILAQVLVYLLLVIVYVPLLLRLLPDFFSMKATFDTELLRRLFSFGWPLLLITVTGIFLTYVDTFFLTLYRTLPEVGLFNVALPTANLMLFISGVIYAVMYPVSSEIKAKKNVGVFSDGISRMYVFLLIFLLPFTAIFLLFPDIIINALFGAQYVGAALTLQVLVVAGFFYSFSQLNASIIAGMGDSKKILRTLIIAATVNVIGDIVLIPKYGIVGSAIATLLAFTILFFANLRVLTSIVQFNIDYSKIFRLALATILFGAAIVFLRQSLALPLWWKIFVSLSLSGVIYIAGIFILKIVTVKEIRALRNQLR